MGTEGDKGYLDMGFARLDTMRAARTGFPEVVFCEGKADAHIGEIFCRLYEKNGEVLGTRATPGQAEIVKRALEEGYVADSGVVDMFSYDAVSRIIKIEKNDKERKGLVAICSGGTADIPVAEEAAATAEFFGAKVARFYDVGISGLHRLMSVIDEIRNANCIVAVAGMEGALPSVLGGLVENPVIAVPTSIGYGVAEGGRTALNAMLTSCANGVVVVNIDNGYGAGYVATQINRLAVRVF